MRKLKRRLCHRTEEGQALLVVLGMVAIVVLLATAIEVSLAGRLKVQATTSLSEEALQAANTGLADYESWLTHSTKEWEYAYAYCSKGAFSTCGENPDPHNPAYSGKFDPACATSSSNASTGAPGATGYFGWESVRSSGGSQEQFQYVVNSTKATTTGGEVHVYVQGRAGRSGDYTCRTIKALYDGPQVQKSTTTLVAPNSCNGATIPETAPKTTHYMEIEAIGGDGQSGGESFLSFGGSPGGTGAKVTADYAISQGTTIYVNNGCQGGANHSGITTGGYGFNPGGSMPSQNDDAGGGGGSTAVCKVKTCSSVSKQGTTTYGAPITTVTELKSDVYLIASGGGGGGESFLFATGGNGGDGTTGSSGATTVAGVGLVDKGTSGSGGFFSSGGAGGSGTKYLTCTAGCAVGHPTFIGGDGGAGGGGFSDGLGGTAGWSGGGGGAGESYINTTSNLSYVATSGTWTGPATGAGLVIITWLNKTKAPIGSPIDASNCGFGGQNTVAVASGTTLTITLAGGNGGPGNEATFFGQAGHTTAGGWGATISATYKNESSSTVFLTAIQGCDGLLGEENGGQTGGAGLGNGGRNCAATSPTPCTSQGGTAGAGGSGGGASAICAGSVGPNVATQTDNNCTYSSSPETHLLLVAAGGGGGAENNTCVSANAGGSGGSGTAYNWTTTAHDGAAQTTKIFGLQAGANGAGPTGTWSKTGRADSKGGPANATTYAPTGTAGEADQNGWVGGIDSGGGGGGYTNGNGGKDVGTYIVNCLEKFFGGGTTPGGGGGGSSYAARSLDGMVVQTCAKGTGTCPSLGVTNTGTGLPYEIVWGHNTSTTATGNINIKEDQAYAPAALIYEAPTAKGTTTW